MGDKCRPVEIDGDMIRVRVGEPMTEEDVVFFGQIVRLAKAKFAEQHATALAAQSALYTETPIQDDAGEGES